MAEYVYYASSAGDLRPVTTRQLFLRLNAFSKVHKQEIKNRILLAGGKVK